MKKQLLIGLILILFPALLIGIAAPAFAAPVAQYTLVPKPTPGADGRIIYIAKAHDTAWTIAAIFGISLDELKTLNKWGDNPIIQPGQEVVLGYAGPVEPTSVFGPTATPELLLPTPSQKPGNGDLCVILYNDRNGDSLRQADEPSIPGGAISVSESFGPVSKTATTGTGLDPICFQGLPEGNYNVTVAAPSGYNPTTATNRTISLKAGDTITMDFGAQANSETIVQAPAPQGSGKSPLLGILGGLLLLVGVGVGLLAGRLLKAGGKVTGS